LQLRGGAQGSNLEFVKTKERQLGGSGKEAKEGTVSRSLCGFSGDGIRKKGGGRMAGVAPPTAKRNRGEVKV